MYLPTLDTIDLYWLFKSRSGGTNRPKKPREVLGLHSVWPIVWNSWFQVGTLFSRCLKPNLQKILILASSPSLVMGNDGKWWEYPGKNNDMITTLIVPRDISSYLEISARDCVCFSGLLRMHTFGVKAFKMVWCSDGRIQSTACSLSEGAMESWLSCRDHVLFNRFWLVSTIQIIIQHSSTSMIQNIMQICRYSGYLWKDLDIM